MHYLIDVFEDLAIIAASIVTILVSLYLFLVIVQWGIKMKYGNREQDGLTTLWQDCLKKDDTEKSVQNQEGEEG